MKTVMSRIRYNRDTRNNNRRTPVIVLQPQAGKTGAAATLEPSGLEAMFDAAFATELALREKQIQQNYRPVIGIHKWFARRPGTVFRSLLLAEVAERGDEPVYVTSENTLAGAYGKEPSDEALDTLKNACKALHEVEVEIAIGDR